jgi:hypothetical protein
MYFYNARFEPEKLVATFENDTHSIEVVIPHTAGPRLNLKQHGKPVTLLSTAARFLETDGTFPRWYGRTLKWYGDGEHVSKTPLSAVESLYQQAYHVAKRFLPYDVVMPHNLVYYAGINTDPSDYVDNMQDMIEIDNDETRHALESQLQDQWLNAFHETLEKFLGYYGMKAVEIRLPGLPEIPVYKIKTDGKRGWKQIAALLVRKTTHNELSAYDNERTALRDLGYGSYKAMVLMYIREAFSLTNISAGAYFEEALRGQQEINPLTITVNA